VNEQNSAVAKIWDGSQLKCTFRRLLIAKFDIISKLWYKLIVRYEWSRRAETSRGRRRCMS
jgi:hypothetical protein